MRRIPQKMLVLVAFAAFAGGAQAVAEIGPTDSYSFGVLSSSRAVSVSEFGAFDNTFSFIQGAYPGANGVFSGLDVVGDLMAQMRLGVGVVPTWSPWSSSALVPSDPETGAFALSQSHGSLIPGETYWFELKGSATQATYQITLAPVPEPESWAMLLSGMGLIGFVAHRRRRAA